MPARAANTLETGRSLSLSSEIVARRRRRDADIKAAEWKAAVREQERISAELHDGLGQHLTGIAFLAKAIANKLRSRGVPEATDTDQIVMLINQAVANTRSLARGLQPVGPEDNALSVALRQLAVDVSKVYGVNCRFSAEETVLIPSRDAAHHLYRIAQEAVNNAITHGGADTILIELNQDSRSVVLSVTNNGVGLDKDVTHVGLGLFSMQRRARILRAKMYLENLSSGGVSLRIAMRRKLAQSVVRTAVSSTSTEFSQGEAE